MDSHALAGAKASRLRKMRPANDLRLVRSTPVRPSRSFFSPHRQHQFSKMETNSLGSKGSLKTIKDAFRFVAAATAEIQQEIAGFRSSWNETRAFTS
jgi:hypothetical protein